MTTAPARPRGITLGGYLTLIGVGVAASCLGRIITASGGEGYQEQGLGRLSLGLLLEMISWAAYPIAVWLLVVWLRRDPTGPQRLRLLGGLAGLALLSEVPYDLITTGAFVSFDSQNPVWALVIILIVHESALRWKDTNKLFLVAVVLAAIFWLLLLSIGMRLGIAPLGLVMLAFYGIFMMLWGRENTMMLTAGALGAVTFLTPALGVVFLHYRRVGDTETGAFPAPLWALAYPTGMAIAGLLAGVLS